MHFVNLNDEGEDELKKKQFIMRKVSFATVAFWVTRFLCLWVGTMIWQLPHRRSEHVVNPRLIEPWPTSLEATSISRSDMLMSWSTRASGSLRQLLDGLRHI